MYQTQKIQVLVEDKPIRDFVPLKLKEIVAFIKILNDEDLDPEIEYVFMKRFPNGQLKLPVFK